MELLPELNGGGQRTSVAKDLEPPKVGVILVNWHGAEFTLPCVESLLKSNYPNFQIVVVDDGSTDGSPDRIAHEYPQVELLRQPTNSGVSKARNRGIRHALDMGCEYALMMDNDTRADPGLISSLVETAESANRRAVVGPKIYWLRDPDRLWFAFGRLSLWTGLYSNPAYNQQDRGQFEKAIEMEVASSCCMLMPRKALETAGGFDEAFGFRTHEDVDLSLRCRRAGFRIIFSPKAKIWHLVGGSAQKMSGASIRFHATRDQLWTLRKAATRGQMISIAFFYPFRAIVRISGMIARGQWDSIPAELRGAKEGFFAPIAQGDPARMALPLGK
jgi:GT2 family glycosyltransferase